MLRRVVYWIAVLFISTLLVVALILFFESRDQSQVGGSVLGVPQLIGSLNLA